MFKRVTSQIEDPGVRELLEYVLYEPEALEDTIRMYKTENSADMYAYEAEGELIGLIGYKIDSSRVLEIVHLIIHPECRMQGYGRDLVLEALGQTNPDMILAVADEDGAQFFRNIGFQITGFTDESSGEERFRCVYLVQEEEAEE